MSRIIPFEDQNNIPSLETITRVLNNRVLPLVNRLHSAGNISGAVFYGSVPRNEHSNSSDIDVLVRYIHTETLHILKRERQIVKNEKGIIIEFATFSDQLAETPFHREGYSYFNHICANTEEKIVVGRHPKEGFFHPRLSANAKDDRVMYAQEAGSIINSIVKRYIESGDNEVRYEYFLKALLEKPKHFVRECVCLINNGLPAGKDGKTIDNNSDLLTEFYKEFPKKPLSIGEKMDHIYHEISLYNKYLNGIKEKTIKQTKENYSEQLKIIEDTFPHQIKVMTEVAKYLNQKFQLSSIDRI